MRRLEAALVQQARLGDAFARLAGTQAEQSAFVRLQAASQHVARCDAVVKAFTPAAAAREHVGLPLGNALAFSVDGGVGAAGEARAEFVERLGPKLAPAVVEDAKLLISELVTNCVLHGVAREPGSRIDVTASLFAGILSVEVSDGGPSFERKRRQAGPGQRKGLGLEVVDRLSSRWGISGGDRGAVWFELARAA